MKEKAELIEFPNADTVLKQRGSHMMAPVAENDARMKSPNNNLARVDSSYTLNQQYLH